MITAFTIPKPFSGHIGLIQRNAIQSWKAIGIQEIFLVGNDDGVAEAAKEFGVYHIPYVERNEFGTPLLSSAFASVEAKACNHLIMYVNADILFVNPLESHLHKIRKPHFLLSGRRWDLDVNQAIEFGQTGWELNLQRDIASRGVLHGFSGKDYFLFPKGTVNMPAFAVGRPGWDDWLIYDSRIKGIPVIDATEAITIIHQNHNYSHSKFGGQNQVGGPELGQNVAVAGSIFNMMTLREANWILTPEGLKKPRLPRRIYSILARFPPWRMFLGIIRIIRNPDAFRRTFYRGST